MMKYPKEYLEEIKQRIKVSDVVGQSVKLKRRGKEFIGLSPFTNEKTPSFTINDEKGFYHCFSSGEHGNIFDFLVKIEKLTFGDAVRKLAAKAGMQPFKFTETDIKRETYREKYSEILNLASTHYQKNLSENKEVQDYVKSRELHQETISKFKIGFSGENGLDQHLFSKFSRQELIDSGIFFLDDKKNILVDRFRNRLMFPIYDWSNKLIAFGGRALSKNFLAKYINSPETEFFKKSFNLYNLNFAKVENKTSNEVVVVEGYMDAISLYQAGFKNVVATLGTAMTEFHLNILWKNFRKVIICYDGDKSGRAAAEKIAEKLICFIKPEYSLSFLLLPTGFDPDSFIKSKKLENFLKYLKNRIEIADFIFQSNLESIESLSPENIAGLEKKLTAISKSVQDETIGKHYLSYFKNQIFENFYKKNNKLAKPLNITKKLASRISNFSEIEIKELSLVYLCIQNPKLCIKHLDTIRNFSFAKASLEKIKVPIEDFLKSRQDFVRQDFLNNLIERGFQNTIDDINEASVFKHIGQNLSQEKFDIFFEDIIQQIKFIKDQSLLIKAQESLSKNMTEAQYNEFLALKNEILQSKKL